MNVLVVTPWFPNSVDDGRYNFILHSVRATQSLGVQNTVMVCRPYRPMLAQLFHPDWKPAIFEKDQFDDDFPIVVESYFSLPRNYFHFMVWESIKRQLRSKIVRLLDSSKAQVVHVHTETLALAVAPVARSLGIPMVVTVHGINPSRRLNANEKIRKRLKVTLESPGRTVLVGDPLRAYLMPIVGTDDNFKTIPNGFHLPGRFQERSIFRGATTRYVSVANLHEGKGIDLTLRALSEFHAKGNQQWSYVIIGEGSERPLLEKMVLESGLEAKVSFLGHLPHFQALEHVSQSDVFILPSYREAFGVAYLEAMALGLVTVGVQGQGPKEFIKNGISGFLLKPRDVPSIVELLSWIEENKQECKNIARRGQNVVCKEFTWEAHAQKLKDLYTELSEQKKNA